MARHARQRIIATLLAIAICATFMAAIIRSTSATTKVAPAQPPRVTQSDRKCLPKEAATSAVPTVILMTSPVNAPASCGR